MKRVSRSPEWAKSSASLWVGTTSQRSVHPWCHQAGEAWIQGLLLGRPELSYWRHPQCAHTCMHLYSHLQSSILLSQRGVQDEDAGAISVHVSPLCVCQCWSVHMYLCTVYVRMCLLAAHDLRHCWLELGAWSCGRLVSIRLSDLSQLP